MIWGNKREVEQRQVAERRLIDIETVALQLGVCIKTVYGWVNMRRIPFIKVGRLVRFDPSDIEAWISARKVDVWDKT